jgi:hypothetical protein
MAVTRRVSSSRAEAREDSSDAAPLMGP